MLQQILGLMNFLLGRADRLRDRDLEQRTRVAQYLRSVSDCLARVATELRAQRVPYSACAELAQYARQLPPSVEQLLGEDVDLLSKLQSAAHSRMAGLQRPGELEFARQHIAVIEETAGTVKALAETLAVP
jgi:hypothetical protein